jgi:hypothetical protein
MYCHVIIDWFWTGIVHSHVFNSRSSVAASNFVSVPVVSPASATSFSQQQLTKTEPQQFSD